MNVATIPGGRSKGTPINEAPAEDLQWWVNKIDSGLRAEPGKKYADKDRQWLAAAQAELARRNGGGAQAPAQAAPAPRPPSQAMAVHHAAPLSSVQSVVGSYRDAQKADQVLASMAAHAHLVSPAPTCGQLPEGCSLVLSQVLVESGTETYEIPGGKLGLGKVALDKIAGAVGLSWDPVGCRRLDDGSDPHYCHYQAVGRLRDFDGSERVLTGEVEIDMRDGGAEVESVRLREAKKKAAQGANYRGDGGASELAQVRKFILRHAESKAKNRAIRGLGVRPAYTQAELQKPFVAARVQFTGQTNDPELRKMFAEKTAEAFLGAKQAAYGGASAPPALPQHFGHSPPPVGAVPADDEALEPSYFAELPAVPAAAAAPPAPPTPKPQPAAADTEAADRAKAAEIDRGESADGY